MSQPVVERRSGRSPTGVDRRQRKQDPWRKVLNLLAYVVYPLLILNVFLFMAIASEDQKRSATTKMELTAAQMEEQPSIPQREVDAPHTATQNVSGWVHLYAFLPIMIVGIGIGGIGIVLDRKRSRRRSDFSLMTPMVLVIISVAGLLIYFIVRGFMN